MVISSSPRRQRRWKECRATKRSKSEIRLRLLLLKGKKPSKNNPIDKPCPQKDLDDFLRFIEKHGDRRAYEALKEIVDAPFEEKPKGGDAPKTTAPDSKKSEKKDIPIVFISAEDGIVAEVPEDSILEFLDLMEMLGED